MKELSNRTADFTDSVIRRMTRVANKYNAINLSQGFPDFEPPKEITKRLPENVGVAAVPGSSFFKEDIRNYVRLHFAKRDETLNEALRRIATLREKAARAKEVTWR